MIAAVILVFIFIKAIQDDNKLKLIDEQDFTSF